MVLSLSTTAARKSYGQIADKLEVGNLIQTQLDSFEWFKREGLRELFNEINPITDYTGKNYELRFLDYEFGEPKYDEEDCRQRDMTFSAPLRINTRLHIKTGENAGEIKEAEVFMGDFAMMTGEGTFIVNGTERVVVSQLVRSPGVYFTDSRGPHHRPPALRGQADPQPRRVARGRDVEQGRPHRQDRSQAQGPGHHAGARHRLREQRRHPRLLRGRRPGPRAPVHRRDAREGRQHDRRGGARRAVPQDPPGRSANGRERAQPAQLAVLQRTPLRPLQGRPVQARQEPRHQRGRGARARVGQGSPRPRQPGLRVDHPQGHPAQQRPR